MLRRKYRYQQRSTAERDAVSTEEKMDSEATNPHHSSKTQNQERDRAA
jgi:hypothetical protein